MWRCNDELQTMLRESAESFALGNDGLNRFRKCRENDKGFEQDAWQAMAELGWTGILLSEDNGGSGLGLGPALTLAEVFGEYLVPEPFVASSVIAATVLDGSSSPWAKELAGGLVNGSLVISVAAQEKLNEIDPALPSTTIERRGAGVVLKGRKLFVPAWSGSTWLLVTAAFEGDTAVVAVAPGLAGTAAASKRMLDGSFTADIDFTDVEIDETAIILRGGNTEEMIDLALARGRLALCAQLEGLSRALLRMTVDYVNQRIQFDKPLASFQALRHKLVEVHTLVEQAGASWRAAAARLEVGLSSDTRFHVSVAKARCSDAAAAVSKSAIQYHGAFGYTEEADVGLFVNAALRWSSWLGNSTEHRRAALFQHKMRRTEHA